MPSFSATDWALAATGNRPVDTSASQPSATEGSRSNCSAVSSAMRRGMSAGFVSRISTRTGQADRHQRHIELGEPLAPSRAARTR
jgi:hypothetical protein